MKHIDFWFDALSPYAWLAFDRLPQALEGLNVQVSYQPLLLAGLLAHWGQKGPAEIAPKRDWTYRQVLWLAHQQGTPLQLPRPHPFNPLALQRLAVATSPAGGTTAVTSWRAASGLPVPSGPPRRRSSASSASACRS